MALGLTGKGGSEVSDAAETDGDKTMSDMEPSTQYISHESWVSSCATSEESLRWN